MKLAPRGAAAALSVAALVVSLGVGAAAATAAVAPAPAATTSSSTTTTTAAQNVIRTWTFEDGSLAGTTGIGGASVAVDAASRRGGALGLHVGQAANYGAGFNFQFDTGGLADGWYDLWIPVKLATGDPVRMQATGAGQTVPPVWVNNGWTAGPSLHFQKVATTTRVSVDVTTLKLCPDDPATPPAEFAVDDISLRRAGTQGPIPYPTVGCTSTTTTPVTTTPVTSTTAGTITTTPGGLVRHWDFGRDGLAGWSPLSGTTLSTQPDPAGGTDLVVSGAGSIGSGATLTIDATNLRDDTWYDLVVPVRLPAGTQPVLFKIWANGGGSQAAVASDSAWRSVNVHFRKRPGQTSIPAMLTVQADCSTDHGFGSGTFLVADASLYQAFTQAEITYTTTGCPLITTTTTTTTTSVTTSPGTVIKRWDFGSSDRAAWSPYLGTTLGTQADPAGGTDLVVSGAGAYGSGATVMIDGSTLTDNAWYDLAMDLRLPAGSPSTQYRVQTPGSWDPATSVSDTGWRGVRAHFRKRAGQTQIPVNVFSIPDCAADKLHAPDTFLVNGAALRLSTVQFEVTWTVTGCPTTTTTPVTTTTTTTTTTSPTAGPVQCRAIYSESRWSGGFQGNIGVTNTGSSVLRGWTLSFTLTSGSLISAWPVGVVQQTGTRVTISAPPWSPDLAPGQSVQVGFVASGSGSVTDIRLNGVPCSGGPATSTTSYNNNS